MVSRIYARHSMVLTRQRDTPTAPRGHLQYLLYLRWKGALEKKLELSVSFWHTKETHSEFKYKVNWVAAVWQ